MTEVLEPTRLDFNELARLVSRELDGALRSYNVPREWDMKPHIASVHVTLGQQPPPPEAEEKPADKGERSGREDTRTVLLLDRYPLARQGWLFEIQLSAGPAPPRARGPDGQWFTPPLGPEPVAALLFQDMPVSAIKGADEKWAERLHKAGVSTVGELSALSDAALASLIRSSRSRFPVELRFKARLLGAGVPDYPASPADGQSLLRLVGEPPEALRELIGAHKFSATGSERLNTLLSLLFTVAKAPVLERLTLGDLRKSRDGER